MAINRDEVHKNDIGTVFVLIFKEYNEDTKQEEVIDISTATAITFYFYKPNSQTVLTKTASLVTDGTDGKAAYTTIANDLDEVGDWKLQGKVEMPSGTWSSSIVSFDVKDNIW